jgi:predicted thioesterase
MTVNARAELVEIDGRRLKFKIEAGMRRRKCVRMALSSNR